MGLAGVGRKVAGLRAVSSCSPPVLDLFRPFLVPYVCESVDLTGLGAPRASPDLHCRQKNGARGEETAMTLVSEPLPTDPWHYPIAEDGHVTGSVTVPE